MESSELSRFALRGQPVKLACSCGEQKLTVMAHGESVVLQIPCHLCESMHLLQLSAKRFWRVDLEPLLCPDTGLQLGVFGQPEPVATYLAVEGNDLERLLADDQFAIYFDHPQVMYYALTCVHTLADQGKLTCCCGQQEIEINIYPEHLELCCSACGRSKEISANKETDMALWQDTNRIEVQ
jgi:hypothetical protein